MVLRLSERLEIPLRQRNRLLLAAGFAPGYGESRLDDASFAPAMEAVRMVLKGHEPNPAAAVDRHWNLVAANRRDRAVAGRRRRPVAARAAGQRAAGSACIQAASRRASSISRNGGRICWNGCGARTRLLPTRRWKSWSASCASYPAGVTQTRPIHNEATAIAHMLKLRVGDATLSLISTITVFGTPLDVTLSELAIESFFPADEATRMALERLSMASA